MRLLEVELGRGLWRVIDTLFFLFSSSLGGSGGRNNAYTSYSIFSFFPPMKRKEKKKKKEREGSSRMKGLFVSLSVSPFSPKGEGGGLDVKKKKLVITVFISRQNWAGRLLKRKL